MNTISDRSSDWRTSLRKELKNKNRLSLERSEMPELDAVVRSGNYEEVNTGLTYEMAIEEAKRCIDCPDPTCMIGCPVSIDIPGFIKSVEKEDLKQSIEIIKRTNLLPAVCGRVCPQEKQCENQCFYKIKLKKEPVAIGNLERFVADYERENLKLTSEAIAETNGIKLAIIGSGPAGLAFAGEMAMKGYVVTVFEALHELGGVLRYGIPEFRLPNDILDYEIAKLKDLGVEFRVNFIVGATVTVEQLKEEGFQGFFVGSGAGLPRFMNIPGENSNGIMSSNEYLTRINLMQAHKEDYDTPINEGKNVIVIGGGNTAMDSVRTAKRLGAERAMIVYRRSLAEMPARIEEVRHAQEEGIEFINLTNPVSYNADENGFVKQMIVQKMELGEPDESGRRRPFAVEGSEYAIDVDLVVVSVGVSPNPLIPKTVSGLNTTKWGTIIVNDETLESDVSNIYAGGDIVRGGATVILAMGDGRKAANSMHENFKTAGLV